MATTNNNSSETMDSHNNSNENNENSNNSSNNNSNNSNNNENNNNNSNNNDSNNDNNSENNENNNNNNNSNNNIDKSEELDSDNIFNKLNKLSSEKSFYKTWTLQVKNSGQDQSASSTDNINSISNLSFVIATQIKNLISNLTKKTYKANSSELSQIINQYGSQAEIYIFRTLVDSIDFKNITTPANTTPPSSSSSSSTGITTASSSSAASGTQLQLRVQLFKEEFSRLTKQPHFISVLCKAFDGYENLNFEFFGHFSSTLKLNPSHELMLGLALSQSLDKSVREQADKFLLHTLTQLSQSNTKSLPENVLHQLLYKFKIQETQPSSSTSTSSSTPPPPQQQQYNDILKYLQSISPANSLALSPLVDDQNIPNSKRLQQQDNPSYVNSIISKVSQQNVPHQIISSIGFSSCSSVATLKDILFQFPKLTESDIAHILISMAELTSQSNNNSSTIPYLTFSDLNKNNNNNNNNNSNSGNTSPSTNNNNNNNNNNNSEEWNIPIFIEVVKELYSNIDWDIVIRELDCSSFNLFDLRGLSFILAVYNKATNSTDQFPIDFILDRIWVNSLGQIQFLKLAIQSEFFPFSLSQKKKVDQASLGKAPPTITHWNSLSLIETLLQLSDIDQEHYQKVNPLFEFPIRNCPDLLILGVSSIALRNNRLQNELLIHLFNTLLQSHNYQSILSQLWKDHPQTVVQIMSDIYQKDPRELSRFLDIAQELKILRPMLYCKTYPFIINLALLASQREYLFLERWVQERMKEEDHSFVQACVSFLSDRIAKRLKEQSNGDQTSALNQPIPLSNSVLLTLHKALSDLEQQISPALVNELKQLGPQLQNSEEATERRFPPEVEDETNAYFIKLYSGEITVDQIISILKEYKVSKNQKDQDIFRCLLFNLFDEYKFLSDYPDKELKITGVLFGSLIKNLLISSQPLRVALKYVLEALRFPIKSNMFIFGFNALISFPNRLVEWPQYWAQICSIDHFRDNYGEMIAAINRMIDSSDPTKQHQQDFQKPSANSPPATTILSSQQIQDAENFTFDSNNADLRDSISNDQQQSQHMQQQTLNQQKSKKDNKQSQQPQQQQQQSKTGINKHQPPPQQQQQPQPQPQYQPNNTNDEDAFSTSIPLGTLLNATKEIIQPDDAIKDKIYFIINNISQHNLDQKAKDLKDILKPEYYDFFAQYLVVKRVSIEANFHALYLAFIDRLAIPAISEKILYFSQQNIHTLLKSEKIRVDHSERSLLKNLGGWLGMNTLARNKPLLQKVISPKDLLIYAAENGLLIAIVPFVSKLLEYCQQSKVFKPPNPWVMAIVRLMLEIYNLKDSKNNIKFEIELLFNNLKIEFNDVNIKPSTILAERRAQREMEQQQDDSLRKDKPQSSLDLLQNLPRFLVYNASLGVYAQSPIFKKATPLAFEKAIREIIGPVVERSVAISVITSKELVSKDFATESDESKMRRASHLMVQNLAGSLALVTCKDPLRVSITAYLKTLLQNNNSLPPSDVPLDVAISVVCNDNLDFGCTIIETAAKEKAILAIDEVLAPSYNDRAKHKEQMGQQPFYDMSYLNTPIFHTLPDSLRPKPGGIQPDQFRVYEDFTNLSHHANVGGNLNSEGGAASSESNQSGDVFLSGQGNFKQQQQQQVSQQQQMQQQMLQQQQQQLLQQQMLQQQAAQQQIHQQQQQGANQPNIQMIPNSELSEKFLMLMNEVEKVVIRLLGQGQSIELELLYTASQQILSLVRLSPNQSELLAGFAQKIVSRLVDPEKKPLYEVYFELLEVFRDWDQKVITNITSFVLFSSPDKKLNRLLIAGLIIHQLINVNEYDLALSKMLVDNRNSSSIEFALSLVRFCLIENNYANISEFPSTLDLLQKFAIRQPNEMLVKTLEDIKNNPKEDKKRRFSRIRQEDMIVDPPGLKEAVIALLQDWLVFSSANNDYKILVQYLSQVLQISFMKNELYFIKFFRLGLEYSLERYQANFETNTPQYLEVDSWCRFVVLMVKHADPTKLNMLTKVLSVLIKTLTKDYESNPTRFNQRPYLRIFENLIVDLTSPDPILEQFINHILFCFVNALATLQPQKYPGFCFAWLDLLSHKSFMPKLLNRQQRQWFHALLCQHFKFMEPFLRNPSDLSNPTRILYRGTLKVLLVLLHDFPEFLCEYHFSLCDVIPASCVQLRNIILSAFPRNMRLPDPFTLKMKIDSLPDIAQPPKILSNYVAGLKNLKNEVDIYLKTRGPYSFLTDLKSKVTLSDKEEILVNGSKYNIQMINSLVLYLGTMAIPTLQNKNAPLTPQHSAPMDIFHRLALDLDCEGRYIFLNAIANQLRYPNSHTHYFSCVLLFLFSECNSEIVKEQITRVLLERLISSKPHPWGLLVTFIELIKNIRFNFWSHSFTKIAPEISKLFDSVAKSCLSRENQQQ